MIDFEQLNEPDGPTRLQQDKAEIKRLRDLLLEGRQWAETLRGVYLYRDNTIMAEYVNTYLKKLEMLFPAGP